MKGKKALRNVSYTVTSNFVSFLISAIVTFFVPKLLGVEEYGYFQLYIFYTSYTAFLYFGWGDGIYLRYGGAYYNELDKAKINGQFWGIIMYEMFVLTIILFISHYISSVDKGIVIMYTGFYILIMWPKTILLFILQCTNRIREYSFCVIVERVIYLIIVIVLLLTNFNNYVLLLRADLAGRMAALLLVMYYCKDIVTTRPEKAKQIIAEAWTNISVGVKLTLSNIAGMLVIGIVRYAIEIHWDIATFGKVSLSLSVSNMLMVFVNAVSLVMFPMLRRVSSDTYAEIYNCLRNILMVCLLGVLITYYPVKAILSVWLPQYEDGLTYMAILFPLCVFESKNNMLIATYLKTLRMEARLLYINIATLIISGILTYITVTVMDNLDLAIISILFSIAFRCIAGEIIVSSAIDINVKKDVVLELSLVMVFVFTSWFLGGAKGMIIYCAAYAMYLIVKRNDIIELRRYLKG